MEWVSNTPNNKDLDTDWITTEVAINENTVESYNWEDVKTQTCFDIEYVNSDDIEVNTDLKVRDDPSEGQTIFTFKPKVTERDETDIRTLCLQDVIAMKAQDFNIAFKVMGRKREDTNTRFTFSVEQNNIHVPKTPGIQTFLTPMQDDRMEWQQEWLEILSSTSGPMFTQKNDHVEFYGKYHLLFEFLK